MLCPGTWERMDTGHGTCSLPTADAHKLRTQYSALGTDPKAIEPPRDMISGALTGVPGPRAH